MPNWSEDYRTQKGEKMNDTSLIIIFVEIVVAAMLAVIVVILHIHRSTNKIIYRLEDTKLRTAIEANSQVIDEVRKEIISLAKHLAALNNR